MVNILLIQQRKPSVILAEFESLPQAHFLISCEHVVINQNLQRKHFAEGSEILLYSVFGGSVCLWG